jgi:hypothetical protein
MPSNQQKHPPEAGYHAPSSKHIEKYVQMLCEALTERKKENYCTTEIMSGLEEFLTVVAKMKAKELNRTHKKGRK